MSVFVGNQGKRRVRAWLGVGIGLLGFFLTAGCGGASSGKSSVQSELASAIQLQQQGKLAAAQALYLKVTAAQPSNYYAQYDLGVIAQTRGELFPALSYYNAALVANPKYVPAMFNEATIYARSNPPNAIALYRRAVALQPTAPTAYLNLGLLENANGQVKQGTRDLATAVKQDPALINQIPRHLRGLILAKASGRGAGSGASPTATPSTAVTPTATAS